MGRRATTLVAVLLLALAGCSRGSPAARPASTAAVRWELWRHAPAVVDLTAPRTDGRLTVAAAGHLWLLGTAGGDPQLLPGGYATDPGPEPYAALGTGATVDGAGCAFGRDEVYAIEPGGRPGVVAVDAQGRPRRFADLPGVMPNGIAFDDVGKFGHRLLVTGAVKGSVKVYAIDCTGAVTVIAGHAPTMEGGLAMAPASFGGFGGDLIGPDENSGQIWAVRPDGTASLVAKSGLPTGGDIGVEAAGFVPAGFTVDWSAYVADRRSPGNPHPGDDSVLRLSGAQLTAADVRPGDLLVASEGGAATVAVRCAATCTVRHIADGPKVAHVEGHVIVAPSR